MATKYNIGDPVWAKMKGFSPWPGKVANPTKEVKRPALKKPMHCIFFFGTNNYAWIQEDQIKPYETSKEQFSKSSKTASFKEALEAIEDYVKNLPEGPPPARVAASEDEVEEAPATPTVTPVKTPKTPKEPATTDKEPKRRKRESQDQSHRASKRTSSESSSTSSAPTKRNKAAAAEKTSSVAAATPNNNAAGLNSVSNATSSSSKSSSNLLRQSYVTRPVTPPLDVERISDVLRSKHVSPSNLKFGFLGLGNMGQGMVKNLINSGHHITVWNRTPSKCRDFVKAGAFKGLTPADVVAASDITFCCVSNSHAAKEMVFGNCGVLHEIKDNKGYVEMTSIDPDTSQDISEAIMLRGGRYLEAPVSGSKKPAEDGTLIILAAGDRALFNDCASCFEAIGRHAFYLGEVGNGSKMSLILNMLLGTTLAGLAEAMALCDRAELSQKDLLEILELGDLNSAVISQKGQAIIEGTFATNMPLQHLQKDLCLAIGIGDQLEQPLPVTAAANEVFKHAKKHGYAEHDASAVYIRTRL
ncbi:cytokine-like nuclear factor N-PAC isoform X2 [Dermacentor andersoni]|uniref:cytokine-like nuclear factor N-PAC isoform X2 n=1 Tax=Dermacentor andersoni TaxID=34620 RepID=UPI00215513B7|nr:cytokine-like nuclear factor N-PAC isoform X2 [Dermacentor andersoni]